MKRLIIAIISMLTVICAGCLIAVFRIQTNYQSAIQIQDTEDGEIQAQINSLIKNNTELQTQVETLKQRNAELQSKIERNQGEPTNDNEYQYQLQAIESTYHNLTLNDAGEDSSVLVDSRLQPELIEMLIKHYSAMYNSDITTFKTTLASPENDWVLGFVKKKKQPFKIKIISAWNLPDGFNEFGGQFLNVLILRRSSLNSEDIERDAYTVGVTKQSGSWLVYDYD